MSGAGVIAEQRRSVQGVASHTPDPGRRIGASLPSGGAPSDEVRERIQRTAPREQSARRPAGAEPDGGDGSEDNFPSRGSRDPVVAHGEHPGNTWMDTRRSEAATSPTAARSGAAARRVEQLAGEDCLSSPESPAGGSAADGGGSCWLPPTPPQQSDRSGADCVELDCAGNPTEGAAAPGRPHFPREDGSGSLLRRTLTGSPRDLIASHMQTRSFGSKESIPTHLPSPGGSRSGTAECLSDLLHMPPTGDWRGRHMQGADADEEEARGSQDVAVRVHGELRAEFEVTGEGDEAQATVEPLGLEGAAGDASGRMPHLFAPHSSQSDSPHRRLAPSQGGGGVVPMAGPTPHPSSQAMPRGAHTDSVLPAALVDAADTTPLGGSIGAVGTRHAWRTVTCAEPGDEEQGHATGAASLSSAPSDWTSAASRAASHPCDGEPVRPASGGRTPTVQPSVSTSVMATAEAVSRSLAGQCCEERDSLASVAPDPLAGDAGASECQPAPATAPMPAQMPPVVPVVRAGVMLPSGEQQQALDTAASPACVGAPTGSCEGQTGTTPSPPASCSGHASARWTPPTSEGGRSKAGQAASTRRWQSRSSHGQSGLDLSGNRSSSGVSISVRTPSNQPESVTGRAEVVSPPGRLHTADGFGVRGPGSSPALSMWLRLRAQVPSLTYGNARTVVLALAAGGVMARELAAPAGGAPMGITFASVALILALVVTTRRSDAGSTRGGDGQKAAALGPNAPGDSRQVLLETPPLLVPGPTIESRTRMWTTLVHMISTRPHDAPDWGVDNGGGALASTADATASLPGAAQTSVARFITDAICIACGYVGIPLDAVDARTPLWTAEWGASPELASTLGLILLASVTHCRRYAATGARDAATQPPPDKCRHWIATASSLHAVVRLGAQASRRAAQVPRWRVAALPDGSGKQPGGAVVVEGKEEAEEEEAVASSQPNPEGNSSREMSSAPGSRPSEGAAREAWPHESADGDIKSNDEEKLTEQEPVDGALWISVPMPVGTYPASQLLRDGQARAHRAKIGLWQCTAEDAGFGEWQLLLHVPSAPLRERGSEVDPAASTGSRSMAWVAPSSGSGANTEHAARGGSGRALDTHCPTPAPLGARRTQSSAATPRRDDVAVLALEEEDEDEEDSPEARTNSARGTRDEQAAAHPAAAYVATGRREDPNSEVGGTWDLPMHERGSAMAAAGGPNWRGVRRNSSSSLLRSSPRDFGSLFDESGPPTETGAPPSVSGQVTGAVSAPPPTPQAFLVTPWSKVHRPSPWWRMSRALVSRGFSVRVLSALRECAPADDVAGSLVFLDSALACARPDPSPIESRGDGSDTLHGTGSGMGSSGSSSTIVQCNSIFRSDTCMQRAQREGSNSPGEDAWRGSGASDTRSAAPASESVHSYHSASSSSRRTPGPVSRVQLRQIHAPQDGVRTCRSHRTGGGTAKFAVPPQRRLDETEGAGPAQAPRSGAPQVLVLSDITSEAWCGAERLPQSVKWTMCGPSDWDALNRILADAREGPAM